MLKKGKAAEFSNQVFKIYSLLFEVTSARASLVIPVFNVGKTGKQGWQSRSWQQHQLWHDIHISVQFF